MEPTPTPESVPAIGPALEARAGRPTEAVQETEVPSGGIQPSEMDLIAKRKLASDSTPSPTAEAPLTTYFPRTVLEPLWAILRQRWIDLLLWVLSIIIGGLITWAVSWYWYEEAADDLQWEARVGTLPLEVQKQLVALYNLDVQLKPGQAIGISEVGSSHEQFYSAEQIFCELNARGLATVFIRTKEAAVRWIDYADLGAKLRGYTPNQLVEIAKDNKWRERFLGGSERSLEDVFVGVTDEGEAIAKYLNATRGFARSVLRVYKTDGENSAVTDLNLEDNHLLKRVWPSGTSESP